ncbi:hypothetical protein DOCECA_14625 [Pseudomonas sp. E102]
MGAFLLPAIPGSTPNQSGSEPAREVVSQSTCVLNDKPLSRAGSLPQGSLHNSGGAFVPWVALEVTLVLPAELRRALIPHLVRDLGHAHALAEQQPLGLE